MSDLIKMRPRYLNHEELAYDTMRDSEYFDPVALKEDGMDFVNLVSHIENEGLQPKNFDHETFEYLEPDARTSYLYTQFIADEEEYEKNQPFFKEMAQVNKDKEFNENLGVIKRGISSILGGPIKWVEQTITGGIHDIYQMGARTLEAGGSALGLEALEKEGTLRV